MNNQQRAENGNMVLAFYETLPGVESRDMGACFEQLLTALLADLRHAAAAHDVECFEYAAATSLPHFNEQERFE